MKMKVWYRRFGKASMFGTGAGVPFLVGFLLLFLLSCRAEKKEDPLRIAVAANVREAMLEITAAFQDQTGFQCEVISSSSGKLAAQIREGAPFDLLVSADRSYPEALQREGLAEEPPRVYALGKLILWSAVAEKSPEIEDLLSPGIRHIAVAQPEIAPYGKATREVLKYYDLEQELESRLIFGESIAQVNQFVSSGAAAYGFTSLSTVRARPFKGQGYWLEIDPRAYSPIEQAVCLLRPDDKPSAGAMEFYTYLFSDSAREILESYGYDLP